MWYLRASSVEACTRWVQAIQTQRSFYASTHLGDTGSTGSGTHQASSCSSSFAPPSASPASAGPGPSIYNDNLRRHESVLSISSINSCRSYKEQLSEMETFRNILYQQIKTLQHYFDSSLQSTSIVNEHFKRHRRHQSMNGTTLPQLMVTPFRVPFHPLDLSNHLSFIVVLFHHHHQ